MKARPIAAARTWPGKARWLPASTAVGAKRVGKLLAADVLRGYSQTLEESRAVSGATCGAPRLQLCVRP